MKGHKGQSYKYGIEGKDAHINANDDVFTPDWLAKDICEMFDIKGKILEPCKGDGVFLKYLPKDTDWCEIREGRNFYDYKKKVNWIVTNPPYSDFNRFLEHCFNLADNVLLLIPITKLVTSWKRIKWYKDYGWIRTIWFIGTGNKCGFPFGYPVGAVHFKKGYFGDIHTIYGLDKQTDVSSED